MLFRSNDTATTEIYTCLDIFPYTTLFRSYWPRPGLADVCVRWAEPAAAIDCLVRATNPWNRGALTLLRGQLLRVLSLSARPETVEAAPGTIVLAAPGQALLVACGAGQVAQLDLVVIDEGYFTGGQLAGLGVQVGEVLEPLAGQLREAPVGSS